MFPKFKIKFTEPTDVHFINPQTMKQEWYKCWYGRGTSIDVADILSGNTKHIFAVCTDGEIMFVETKDIRIENL